MFFLPTGLTKGFGEANGFLLGPLDLAVGFAILLSLIGGAGVDNLGLGNGTVEPVMGSNPY